MNVNVRTIPPIRVACFRQIGIKERFGDAFRRAVHFGIRTDQLAQKEQNGDLHLSLPFGALHDDPVATPPESVRFDLCLAVGDDGHGDSKISIQTIGGGEYAVAECSGPHELLAGSYEQLHDWLAGSNWERREGACLEQYLTPPVFVEGEDLETIIAIPVRPRA